MTRPVEIRYKAKKFRIGEFGKRLAELPKNMRRPVLLAFSEYMVKKFKLYPRYKYKSRASAYPDTKAYFENGKPVPAGYFSANQFRFVMAGIAEGRIQPESPHRTRVLKNAWHIEGAEGRDIRKIEIVNDAPAAVFAYHPIYQARQLDLVGWKDLNEMTDENSADALLEAEVYIYNNFDRILDETLK